MFSTQEVLYSAESKKEMSLKNV